MTAIPTFRNLRSTLSVRSSDGILAISLPPGQCGRIRCAAAFSTSPVTWKADNNKNRGVSAVRATGPRPRQTLSVKQKDYAKQKLPKPTERTSEVFGDPNHGLYDFFRDKQLLRRPLDESQHGRAWTVPELQERSWETLQQLWWVCVKERNRLATEKHTRKRLRSTYGDEENETRDKTIQETMKAILDVLVARNDAYRDAYRLARKDPSIDLTKTSNQYQPEAYSAGELYDVPVEPIEPANDRRDALAEQAIREQLPPIEEIPSPKERPAQPQQQAP